MDLPVVTACHWICAVCFHWGIMMPFICIRAQLWGFMEHVNVCMCVFPAWLLLLRNVSVSLECLFVGVFDD